MKLVRAKVEWFTEHGHQLLGVVHVGAHEGQEIPWYLARGYQPVVAFEPQPEPFRRLAGEFGGRITAVQAALSDHDGSLTLQVPRHLHDGSEDTQSTSALAMDRSSDYPWNGRHYGRSLEVPCWRFDNWARQNGFESLFYNTLVIDVQGMELEVLKGFGDYLQAFDCLCVECSARPIYQSEAPAREVIDHLAAQGFEQRTPVESHDDILFTKVGA